MLQAASVAGAVRESLLYVSPMARITIHTDIQLLNMTTCSFSVARKIHLCLAYACITVRLVERTAIKSGRLYGLWVATPNHFIFCTHLAGALLSRQAM